MEEMGLVLLVAVSESSVLTHKNPSNAVWKTDTKSMPHQFKISH